MQVSALAHSLLHLSPEQLGLRTRTEIGGEMVSGQGGANENASPQLLLTSAADVAAPTSTSRHQKQPAPQRPRELQNSRYACFACKKRFLFGD